jgi:hypothetical protein
MKANLQITFLKIAGAEVTPQLLKDVPRLTNSTNKTLEILCKQIEKYFSDHQIKININYSLEK